MLIVLAFTLGYILYRRTFPNDFFWYLFSAQNFRRIFVSTPSSIGGFVAHTWYITLDIYLFLIWVILFRIIPKEKYRLLCIIAIAFATLYRYASILFIGELYMTYTMPWAMLDTFGLGGLLAISVKEDNCHKNCWPEIAIGASGIILCIVYSCLTNHTSIIEAYQSFRSAEGYANDLVLVNIFLFISILTIGVLKYCIYYKHRLLENSFLVKLGGMSYALYIFHWPILVIIKHFIHNPFAIIAVGLLLSLLAAWIWDQFIEPKVNKLLYR